MKKAWIAHNGTALVILAGLIGLDVVVNAGKSENYLNTSFTELALYFCGFNILIAMPLWFIVLLINRARITRKTVGIGLGLFMIFLGMTVYPVGTVIGYMAY